MSAGRFEEAKGKPIVLEANGSTPAEDRPVYFPVLDTTVRNF